MTNPEYKHDTCEEALAALWDLKLMAKEMRANDQYSKDDVLNRIEELIQAHDIFDLA